MNIVIGWDFFTLFLYVFLAVFIAFLFRCSIIAKNMNKKICCFGIEIDLKSFYYCLIYLILIFFVCFRCVDFGIGGRDTVTYMEYFENITYVPFDIKELFLFSGFEYLFYNFMYLVKILGGNYQIFSFFIYSIIIISSIYIVDKELFDKDSWLWIILFFLPFLKSFNIVRNCVAAAIGFVAIKYLNDNKYFKFLLFTVIAFLNHYIAVILFVFGLFIRFFPKRIIEDRKKYVISFFGVLGLTFIFLPLARYFLSISGFKGYLSKIEISLLGYIPYIIAIVLIVWNYNDVILYFKKKNHYVYLCLLLFLSYVLPIFICFNGASRILLFFEIPRYVLYVDLYGFYKKKIDNKYHLVMDVIAIVLIVLWLIFRIYKMWYGYALMPYCNIFFR